MLMWQIGSNLFISANVQVSKRSIPPFPTMGSSCLWIHCFLPFSKWIIAITQQMCGVSWLADACTLGTWIENENQYSFGKFLSHPWPCTSHLGSTLFILTTVNQYSFGKFIPFIILPFMIARPLLVQVCHWLFQVILKVTPQVGNFFGRLKRSITIQQQQLPN